MNNIINNKKIVILVVIFLTLFIFLIIQGYKNKERKSPLVNIESFAMEASKLIKEGKYQEALNIYNKVLSINPSNTEALSLKENFLGGNDGEYKQTFKILKAKILVSASRFLDINEVAFYNNLKYGYNPNVTK